LNAETPPLQMTQFPVLVSLGHMGNTITFDDRSGYLAIPASGEGPGVIVVQEWWGLDSGILTICDELADAGFVALAPDLYHGELAGHTEMDRAAELMTALPMDRAAHDMSAAVDHLLSRPEVTGDGVGVIGFCMGGMLTFALAATRPDVVRVAAVVRGHMAEHDDFFPPDAAVALQDRLTELGVDAELRVHSGTGHAFMAPHNALGTRDAELAASIWPEVHSILRSTLN
jgi:carboxymethylenebutenolidase